MTEGTESAATGSLDLNDLVTTQVDYVNGDGIEVRGLDMNGDEFGGTFIYGVDGTTLEDLRAKHREPGPRRHGVDRHRGQPGVDPATRRRWSTR